MAIVLTVVADGPAALAELWGHLGGSKAEVDIVGDDISIHVDLTPPEPEPADDEDPDGGHLVDQLAPIPTDDEPEDQVDDIAEQEPEPAAEVVAIDRKARQQHPTGTTLATQILDLFNSEPATEFTPSTTVESYAIPERAARELKPHLEVVKERVAEATVDTAPEDRPAAARAAVEEFREELRENDGQPIEAPRPEAPITKPDLGGGISHPARYSDALLPIFAELLAGPDYDHVLDPFAGTGIGRRQAVAS